jgi:molybdopterin-guanine dinucleotide biosynthesis protein A
VTGHLSGVTAIVLTGGESKRFGQDKSTTQLAGTSMLNHVLAGVPDTISVVVVGPTPTGTPRQVRVTREDPPGGGPVAGVVAGLRLVRSEVCCVIATDMPMSASIALELGGMLVESLPGPSRWAHLKMAEDPESHAGVGPTTRTSAVSSEEPPPDQVPNALIPLDVDGKMQPLCGSYSTAALRAAAATLGSGHGASMRSLLALLDVRGVRLPELAADRLFDIDTQADLAAAEQVIMASNGDNLSLLQPGRTQMLNDFAAAAVKELGLDTEINTDTILDVAKDVAHGVERPAAPLSTYLLGYAVAKGASLEEAAAQLRDLANDWNADQA